MYDGDVMEKSRTRKLKIPVTFLLLLITCWSLAWVEQGPRRMALVIGNSDYDVAPLTNPVNDARDITA